MSAFEWESFLRQWSQVIFHAMEDAEKRLLPPDVLESGWLGYSGASEEEITKAEARLGVKLPPSYREFLKVTNGWRQTAPLSDTFNHRLWSTEELERFTLRHPQWIKTLLEKGATGAVMVGLEEDEFQELDEQWEPVGISEQDHQVYGTDQNPKTFRPEYLRTALEISDVGCDSIYLLNPQVVTPDGEWEAWLLADYMDGADRYPSFREMMEAEFRNYLEQKGDNAENTEHPRSREAKTNLDKVVMDEADASLEVDAVESEDVSRVACSSDEVAESEAIPWQSLKCLTVELQTRLMDDRTEYRIILNAGGLSRAKAWSDRVEERLWQWLKRHLAEPRDAVERQPDLDERERGESEQVLVASVAQQWESDALPDSPGSENHQGGGEENRGLPAHETASAIHLELVQIAIYQPPDCHAPILVRSPLCQQSQSLGLGTLKSGHPFFVDVEFQVVGEQAINRVSSDIFYKAQFFVQNRVTHRWTTLGTTTSVALENGCLTYTARLSNQTLEPGMYRMQGVISLSGSTIALSSFELPLLNVV